MACLVAYKTATKVSSMSSGSLVVVVHSLAVLLSSMLPSRPIPSPPAVRAAVRPIILHSRTFSSHQIIFAPLHPIMKSVRIWVRLCLLFTPFTPIYASPDDISATLVTPLFNTTLPLVVDLGYATYQGYYDSVFGLNVFKGYAMTVKNTCSEYCSIIDTGFAASGTPLLQSADCVGKHLRLRGKTTPLSKRRPSLRSVHNPALRRHQRSMGSTLDQVTKTAYSSMSTHQRIQGISQ